MSATTYAYSIAPSSRAKCKDSKCKDYIFVRK